MRAQTSQPRVAAAALRSDMRTSAEPAMQRRRGIAGLSLVAAGAMGLIALYQLGLVSHLPDPPLPHFDADRVDGSVEAYERFSMPDAVLGVGSYATTLGLAAIGGANRARTRPWIPLALAAKVGFDAAQAARMLTVQWTHFRALCGWCLLAAASTAATIPLVIPETRTALQHLRS